MMRVIQSEKVDGWVSLAIVASRFNEAVTQVLVAGALERCDELGLSSEQITLVWVPGAIEIPLTIQRLLTRGCFDAAIALGAVIQGETKHFDVVCHQVSHGCLQVSLECHKPVIFGVLTTDNVAQAFARVGGGEGHKGRDAVDAAIRMISILEQIDNT